MKKYLMVFWAFLCGSLIQANPSVTTFFNTTKANINLELHFSNNRIEQKDIAIDQSYQVVNFDTKKLSSVIFSSLDRDKNGNFYEQLNQSFAVPTTDVQYNIALQLVPAHMIAAATGTDAFKMPDSQKIICTLDTSAKPVVGNIKK